MAEAEKTTETLTTRYELSFLLKTAEDAAKVSLVATRHGAEMVFQSPVNQIRLAYPIKKEVSAYFGFIQFVALPAESVKMNEELGREPAVIRFLLVEASPEAPREVEKPAVAPAATVAPTLPAQKPAATPRTGITTNEALEKRLEEILQ